MKKRIGQFYLLLTILTFIVFVISRFYDRSEGQTLFFSSYFVVVTMLFNLVIVFLYRKHKPLLLYSFLSLVNVVGYYTYITYLSNNLLGIILAFIIPLTFYSSLAALFVAFWIALLEEYMKFVSRILIIIGINNYLFYTIYVSYTERSLIGFFGPFPDDLQVVFNIFYFIKDLNLTVIVALQTIILYYLASGKKFWNYNRTKMDDNES